MHDDNIRAALCLMAGSCAFAVNDTFLKLLNTEIGLFQIITMRGVIVTVLFGLILWRMRLDITKLSRVDRRFLALRALAEAGAAYFFFRALFTLPLAEVTAILQVVPLSVALAAWLFLREPLGWRRLLAICIGFAGVMLILQPGTDAFSMASVHALIAVAMVTLRDLLTRKMAVQVPSMMVAFTTAAGVTLFGALGAVTEPWLGLSSVGWGWLAGASVFVCLGYYLVIQAMRVGEMSFAAPFRYASLLAALLLGWFVLGEWPDRLTLIGSAIVVATGVFTLYRERRLSMTNARRASVP
ncbi:MAG: DMT family transporter [Roseinatronobacter sp.]